MAGPQSPDIIVAAAFCEQVYRRADNDQQIGQANKP
jgi:hypothetical protein